mmetsp:Transcript_36495/g.73577  ORF Transcript_36495/g.73577 Transcript_36495/m.73577 type:complete len:529 (-) Transcript_36495:225-1811(-)
MILAIICAALCVAGHGKVLKIDCKPQCQNVGCEGQQATPDISKAMKELNSEVRALEKQFMFFPILPPLGDVFFDSNKKLVIIIGQFSSGKTTMTGEILKSLSEGNVTKYPAMTIAEEMTNEQFYVIHGDDTRCHLEPNEGIQEDTALCEVAAWFHKKEVTNTKNWHSFFRDVHLCHQGMTLDSLRNHVFIDSPGFVSSQLGATHADKRKSFSRFWRGVLLRADMILVLMDQLAADTIPNDSEFADALQFSRALETRVRIAVNKVASNPCRSDQKSFRDECGKGFSKTIGVHGDVVLPKNNLFRRGILPQLQEYVFGGSVVPVDKLFFTNWGRDCGEETCSPSENCSCDTIKADEQQLLYEITDDSEQKRNTLRATSLMTRWTLFEMHLRIMKKLQNDKQLGMALKNADVDNRKLREQVIQAIGVHLKEVQCVAASTTQECCIKKGAACPVEGVYRAFDIDDLAQYLIQEHELFLSMDKITTAHVRTLSGARTSLNKLLNVQCTNTCSRSWLGWGPIACDPVLLNGDEL